MVKAAGNLPAALLHPCSCYSVQTNLERVVTAPAVAGASLGGMTCLVLAFATVGSAVPVAAAAQNVVGLVHDLTT